MRNRKGLFAFLTVGAVILGLAVVFNYGLAVVGDPPEGTPTPTPAKTATPSPSSDLVIDFSGIKAGVAGKPYSGALKAKNAKNPKWTLGNNNLSEFGLTAPAISFGGNFSIKSINSTTAKEGTATGTVTLISRIGKAEGGGVETDEISGDFKIEIKKGGGSGSNISPKINSFKFDNGKKSMTVTEGDSITFKWEVSNATDVQIIGRLTPQSATDPAGQKNICEELETKKCGLTGELKVNIYRSSAFTLKAKNTLNGKTKTATSAVYVIVKPKPPEKFGTVVVEGTLFSDQYPDGKPYTGRVAPTDAFRFFKNGAEQEKININSLPKVFNRAKGNYKIETEIGKFQLFSTTGKKITASLKDISPNGGELKSGGTVRFGVNFISKATPTPTPTPILKYTCNSDNQCVVSPTGEYGKSNCNNVCQPTTGDLTVTTVSLPDAIKNTAYSQQFSATGGTAPYSWSITSGKLPSGLILNPDGVLSGTPKKEGTAAFTVKAEDKKKKSGSKEFSLKVNSTPTSSVDCGSMPPDVSVTISKLGKANSSSLGRACMNTEFLSLVVNKLRQEPENEKSICWGYYGKKSGNQIGGISVDKITWYTGSGAPTNGSEDVIAFDILKNAADNLPNGPCNQKIGTKFAKEGRQGNWQYPRPGQTSDETTIEPVVAQQEELELIQTDLVASLPITPNKSLIARGLDAMDTIALPVQFYTEKFFRDAVSASFWKKVKKGLEKTKIAPKRKMKSTPSPTK